MKGNRQTLYIMAAMVLGIIVGHICNTLAANPEAAKQIASWFNVVTDLFLHMIKMIIAPLVFSTIVTGIAGTENSKAVGRIGAKALGWFLSASLLSLLIGMVCVNLMQPGVGLSLPLPDIGASSGISGKAMDMKAFIVNIIPKSFFDAMANNNILQILVFSAFFGMGLSAYREQVGKDLIRIRMIQELAHVMLKVTDFVMRFAPLGVFAAIASCITVQGLGVLVTYSKFMASFYTSLLLLWVVLIAVGYLFLKNSIFTLLKLVKEPTILAFSTASSEAALPKTIEALDRFGVKERISGFVLPLGYSFNLDGSMVYMSFATIFIAQAYNIHLSLTQQITMLLVMMLTSKGIAGVARASLVVIAATLPMFNLPEAGLLLIMGIDQFLDMGRTATNVIGNSIATAVVAKWEGDLGTPTETLITDADVDE
jgi:Na+/H+-dicarboxylate symporter